MLVAILVYVGMLVYRGYKVDLAHRASLALGVAADAAAYQEIVDQYADTPSASIALLGVGAQNFSAGDYDAAYAAYDAFEQQHPGHPMVSAARVCKAQCLEATGRLDEALEFFNLFLAESESSYLVPLVLLAKARCLTDQGNWDGARIAYEDLIAGYPETPWANQGEAQLRILGQRERASQRQ